MAAAGTAAFAAGICPLTTRRDATPTITPIFKSKLSVSASAVRTEKQPAPSVSDNGAVAKKQRAPPPSSAALEERRSTLRDYFEQSRELISRSDGGPPRWFSPLECRSPLKDSPLLLYLPGVDGVGMGLSLQHQRLGKIFDIWCMHIPLTDRTSFTDLVKFVESAVKTEHSRAPNRPIYLVGESFGACLALAVAARNPDIDLVLILANPATSYGKSVSQSLLPLSEVIPEQLGSSLPYVLTLLLGNPAKRVTAAVRENLSSDHVIEELSQETIAMSSYLSVLSKLFNVETLRWKLNLLKSAAGFANSRLHAVKAQTLILASGQDQLLPSTEEAERLRQVLPKSKVRLFEDSGHALFLEDGISLISILTATSFYRRGQRHDHVSDYLPPSPSEFRRIYEPQSWIDAATDPVVLSTMENGDVIRGLAGIPSEGPVLYVGYHMMLGFEIVPLVSRFWIERNILLRGIAHPMMFSKLKEGRMPDASAFDSFRIMGAVPVSAPNFFKLFSSKSHVLLYPGGVREALHRKGEEYRLFWPEQSEFVRMAAKFGAKIVPFGVVGEDDVGHLLMDYDDLRRIPYFRDSIEELTGEVVSLRSNAVGEVSNQDVHLPIIVPKIPGRFYFLFGKPIETKGRQHELKGREKAQGLYLEVKSEVEKCLAYLKEKREGDPYRSIFARLSYRATHGFDSEVPTFDFSHKAQQ
ncbi:phytyl ester synthase 2, chloroplastic-like isoform X1 [Salvia hispanica]|uniref:phytyl ester synthase 2, chloroplastic-like isoform X1 n=1 Tax=Salvia hispanica TaxID=49212 RepID=UPI0020099EDD|nr:phytyl ester synthase 2, chloroplastic-like isoform X1 [Salvia hispanica]